VIIISKGTKLFEVMRGEKEKKREGEEERRIEG
jgi:hypothetical protein